MTKKEVKLIQDHIKTLENYQRHLFRDGHTFWHCSMQDGEPRNKPFYYYQINKSVAMSTCSTCNALLENRRKIRSLQKLIGAELTPLYTNLTWEQLIN